jgi:hypothetical protein
MENPDMSPHANVTRAPNRRHSRLARGSITVAALAVGLVSAGPALIAPAEAAANAGSALIANNTLTLTGTNGPDVVNLVADATKVQVAFGDGSARRFDLADFQRHLRVPRQR